MTGLVLAPGLRCPYWESVRRTWWSHDGSGPSPETSVLYSGFVAGSCIHAKDQWLNHLHFESGTRGSLPSRTRAPLWQQMVVLETHSLHHASAASFCPYCGKCSWHSLLSEILGKWQPVSIFSLHISEIYTHSPAPGVFLLFEHAKIAPTSGPLLLLCPLDLVFSSSRHLYGLSPYLPLALIHRPPLWWTISISI